MGRLSTWLWLGGIILAGLAITLFRPRRSKPGADDIGAERNSLKDNNHMEGLTAEEIDRLMREWSRRPGDDKGDTGFDGARPRKKN